MKRFPVRRLSSMTLALITIGMVLRITEIPHPRSLKFPTP